MILSHLTKLQCNFLLEQYILLRDYRYYRATFFYNPKQNVYDVTGSGGRGHFSFSFFSLHRKQPSIKLTAAVNYG